MKKEGKIVVIAITLFLMHAVLPIQTIFGQEVTPSVSTAPSIKPSISPAPTTETSITITPPQSITPPTKGSVDTVTPTTLPELTVTPTFVPQVSSRQSGNTTQNNPSAPTVTKSPSPTLPPTPKPVFAGINNQKPQNKKPSFISFPFSLLKSSMDPKNIYSSQALSPQVTVKLLLIGSIFIIAGIVVLRRREGDRVATDTKQVRVMLGS